MSGLSPDKLAVTVEIDWADDGYQSPAAAIPDWTEASFRCGAEWRDGWPSVTSGKGQLRFSNTDRRWENLTLAQRLSPHRVRALISEEPLWEAQLQPMEPVTRGQPQYGVAGYVASENRDTFGRGIQWARSEPGPLGAEIESVLERGDLRRGSIVLGSQRIGAGVWDSTRRGLLEQLSQLAGAYCGEDRLGNIDFVHWGAALQHTQFELDIDTAHVLESGSAAYRRNVRTHVEAASTLAVLRRNRTLNSTLDELIDPGETVFVEAEASGDTLIRAVWDDPAPVEGLTLRVVARQPRTLVMEVRNTTTEAIRYRPYNPDTLPPLPGLTGDAWYTQSVNVLELASDLAAVVPRSTLRLPSWFAEGELSWARFLFDQYREGVPWAQFTVSLDHTPELAGVLHSGVVFTTSGGNRLELPADTWLCYQSAWELRAEDLSTVTVECVGLPSGDAARYGAAVYGEDTYG